MLTANYAQLGFWTDWNRRNIDKFQILATDFWSKFMTGVVAVSLTLITPYVFGIAKAFLIQLFNFFGWLVAEWNDKDAEESKPLLRKHSRRPQAPKADDNDTASMRLSEDAPSSVNGHLESPSSSIHRDRLDIEPQEADNTESQGADNTESQGANDTQSPENEHRDFIDILKESENSREAVWKLTKHGLNRTREQCGSPSIAIVMIVTILFGLFVAQVVAGVFSAKIASDRAGLSSSKHCGIWQFNDDISEEAADLDDLNNYQKEARASRYARACYSRPDPSIPFSCQMFYNQSIAFSTKTNQPCPFPSSELCFDGPLSAVTFDTDLVDASVLGINAPATHKFRRTTSCSPLNGSEPYIRSREDVNGTSYQYYYGPKDNKEYTFNTSGHPFGWPVPAYSVNTYFSSLFPDADYWKPLPELKQPNDSTLTIMFISSMHIYHQKPSLDPIFYANTPRRFDDLRRTFYYNSDPRARVLACVDKSEVCSPDGKTCWSMNSPVPDKLPPPPAYWMMKWSLRNSNIYDSIKWRLGAALLAQESISQSISIPLPRNHWEVEASQLFATSLARIQHDTWGIAQGEDRHRPGYIEVTPEEAKGHLCGLYKFNTSNYTNINLVAFIGLIVLAIAIFFLSLDARTVGLNAKSTKDESPNVVIGVLVNSIWDLILKIIEMVWAGLKLFYRKSKSYFTPR